MKRTFAYGAAASQGKWPVQEDGYFVDPVRGIFALADGFGGRGNGDLAAKLALQEARGQGAVEESPRGGGIQSPAQQWHRELFGEINRKLLAWNEKRALTLRGGCSLLLASLSRAQLLTVTSCGACGAVLLRGGVFVTLLSPQSSPRMTAGAPLFPSQALGVGRELNPETRTLELLPEDIVILFSSGLNWERDGIEAELLGRMALRAPGSDLVELAESLVADPEGQAIWNQAALLLEGR